MRKPLAALCLAIILIGPFCLWNTLQRMEQARLYADHYDGLIFEASFNPPLILDGSTVCAVKFYDHELTLEEVKEWSEEMKKSCHH